MFNDIPIIIYDDDAACDDVIKFTIPTYVNKLLCKALSATLISP